MRSTRGVGRGGNEDSSASAGAAALPSERFPFAAAAALVRAAREDAAYRRRSPDALHQDPQTPALAVVVG
ncbi:hypothetical protein E2562_018808 [Oryza meyeriana var. granulata]|uniref:Uncharacterized protein n=1 Tax=Oryza meyeriana var. granulata TaxID=110450 RepID=A0A6G1F9R4_9ORYZ|nr:hypothetical protein E2562_018808 [Oryza meyeriana var. granulata]